MATFTNEGVRTLTVFFKLHADLNQVLNSFTSLLDDGADHRFIAGTVPAAQGVLNVRLHAFPVRLVEDGCDATLSPVGGRILRALFCDHGDAMTGVSKFGCGKQTRDSASDDGDVCQLSDLPCPTLGLPLLDHDGRCPKRSLLGIPINQRSLDGLRTIACLDCR